MDKKIKLSDQGNLCALPYQVVLVNVSYVILRARPNLKEAEGVLDLACRRGPTYD